MSNNRESDESVYLLPATERELVAAIRNSAPDSNDEAFLDLASLRLRNIVEKYSEALKRARLGKRSAPAKGQDAGLIDELQTKLKLCREALDMCNQKRSGRRPQ